MFKRTFKDFKNLKKWEHILLCWNCYKNRKHLNYIKKLKLNYLGYFEVYGKFAYRNKFKYSIRKKSRMKKLNFEKLENYRQSLQMSPLTPENIKYRLNYTFVSKNKDEEAIDLMFEKIGDLLEDGEFEKVNEILPTIDLRKLNLNLLVGLLCITRCGTDKPFDVLASYYEPKLLPYRPKLVKEVEKVMYEIEPTERINKLLEGLRK